MKRLLLASTLVAGIGACGEEEAVSAQKGAPDSIAAVSYDARTESGCVASDVLVAALNTTDVVFETGDEARIDADNGLIVTLCDSIAANVTLVAPAGDEHAVSISSIDDNREVAVITTGFSDGDLFGSSVDVGKSVSVDVPAQGVNVGITVFHSAEK